MKRQLQLCRSDMVTLTRYLRDAAQFYDRHASRPRERDRMRLIIKFNNKLNKKLNNYDKANLGQAIGRENRNEVP